MLWQWLTVYSHNYIGNELTLNSKSILYFCQIKFELVHIIKSIVLQTVALYVLRLKIA